MKVMTPEILFFLVKGLLAYAFTAHFTKLFFKIVKRLSPNHLQDEEDRERPLYDLVEEIKTMVFDEVYSLQTSLREIKEVLENTEEDKVLQGIRKFRERYGPVRKSD